MTGNGRKRQWTFVLFGLVVLIITPPIITIYDRPDIVAGVPLSFLVLFVLWAVVIFATAIGTCSPDPGDSPPDDQANGPETVQIADRDTGAQS